MLNVDNMDMIYNAHGKYKRENGWLVLTFDEYEPIYLYFLSSNLNNKYANQSIYLTYTYNIY